MSSVSAVSSETNNNSSNDNDESIASSSPVTGNDLDFEEDCYYAFVSKSETPSFDLEPDETDCIFVLTNDDCCDTLETDNIPENCTVETEIYDKRAGRNRFIKGVRVRFQDLSKPYLAKVSSNKNYTKFLQLVQGESPSGELSPDSGINELASLDPEEQERLKREWADQLAKLEDEIATLRQVLSSKVQQVHELKRKLGFSVWKEFQDDMSQGIKNVKESQVYKSVEEKVNEFSRAVVTAPIYQKTESIVKATTEKTTSLLGGIGSNITSKIGQLKNSDSFRSFEEKMGSAYENVKGRVTPSRSSSNQSFVDILHEDRNVITATTPTISEEK